jgi:hypothetical protein
MFLSVVRCDGSILIHNRFVRVFNHPSIPDQFVSASYRPKLEQIID